jgi:hypothetical protein
MNAAMTDQVSKAMMDYIRMRTNDKHDEAIEYARSLSPKLHQAAFYLAINLASAHLPKIYNAFLREVRDIPIGQEIGALALDLLAYRYVETLVAEEENA